MAFKVAELVVSFSRICAGHLPVYPSLSMLFLGVKSARPCKLHFPDSPWRGASCQIQWLGNAGGELYGWRWDGTTGKNGFQNDQMGIQQ